VGDKGLAIPQSVAGVVARLPNFNTSGREPGTTALLAYSANNLVRCAQVFINKNAVGAINATRGTAFSRIEFISDYLSDGDNDINFGNVSHTFTIKNVMCLFQLSQIGQGFFR
jgi:hypothetical protein